MGSCSRSTTCRQISTYARSRLILRNRDVHGFIQTKSILRICANNEVSDSYLRALEHGMRELRVEHSDLNHILTLLLVSHNEPHTQVSNQGGLPGAMSCIAEKNRSGVCHFPWLLIYVKTFPREPWQSIAPLTLGTCHITYSWRPSLRPSSGPCHVLPTFYQNRQTCTVKERDYGAIYLLALLQDTTVPRYNHRHGPRRKALCVSCVASCYRRSINDSRRLGSTISDILINLKGVSTMREAFESS